MAPTIPMEPFVKKDKGRKPKVTRIPPERAIEMRDKVAEAAKRGRGALARGGGS